MSSVPRGEGDAQMRAHPAEAGANACFRSRANGGSRASLRAVRRVADGTGAGWLRLRLRRRVRSVVPEQRNALPDTVWLTHLLIPQSSGVADDRPGRRAGFRLPGPDLCGARAGPPGHQRAGIAALTLGALGVVFGDIGTSPLYALQTVFHADHGAVPTLAVGGLRRAVARVLGGDDHRVDQVRDVHHARRQRRRGRDHGADRVDPARRAGGPHARRWRSSRSGSSGRRCSTATA